MGNILTLALNGMYTHQLFRCPRPGLTRLSIYEPPVGRVGYVPMSIGSDRGMEANGNANPRKAQSEYRSHVRRLAEPRTNLEADFKFVLLHQILTPNQGP